MTTPTRSAFSPERAIADLLSVLERPARLLVAVSGGSDSTGLLVSLSHAVRAKAETGIEILAVTIDHGLRRESADEALAVGRLCAAYAIPHVIRRWEGIKPAAGISAAARDARYRLLIKLAEELEASAIVTGHTLDDQIETVAMRTARSDRPDNRGLAGMATAVLIDRKKWLLRPFLSVGRTDIRALLQQEGIGWIDDPSNVDPHYERVRTRQALASRPADADLAVAAAIDAAASRRLQLSDAAADLAAEHLTIRHGVLAHLGPEALAADPSALRHLLSLLAAVLGGRAHGPKSTSMDQVMAILASGRSARMTAGRLIFDRRGEGLYMLRESRGMVPLHVAAGAGGVWDGRYRIDNCTRSEVIVGPSAPEKSVASRFFPDLPPAIAMRATACMPSVENVGPAREGIVEIQPMLAPFDGFLPQFDLRLATEFAVLLGCDGFPRLPIKVSARKS